MKQGDEAFQSGSYAAALKSYAAAHDIMHVPTTGLALGRAQEKLGLLVEARDTLLSVQRLPPAAHEPPIFLHAREQAAHEAVALQSRIPSLALRLGGLPEPSAKPQIFINERPIIAAAEGAARKVNPGRHQVVARVAGCPEARQAVTLLEGEMKTVELVFTGCHEGTAPRRDASAALPDEPGGRLAAPAPARPPWVFVGFGLAGAGALVGTVTGAVSLSAASAASRRCDGNRCPPSAEPDIDKAILFGNVSNVAFAVGGVGLGIGIWHLVVKPRPARATTGVTVTAQLTPAGAALSGDF